MRLICPSCGAAHSAESWSNDAAARQCLVVVAELPAEIARRALPYLALFRKPESRRGLSWDKALRLLHGLRQMVVDAYVQWDREPARPNSHQAWVQALEQIIQHPPRRLPLTSHNYLKKVAYDLANDMDKSAERRQIQAERSGKAAEEVRQQWKPGDEDFRRLRQAVKGIVKEMP